MASQSIPRVCHIFRFIVSIRQFVVHLLDLRFSSNPGEITDYCGCADGLTGQLAIYIQILLAARLTLPAGSFDAQGKILPAVLTLVDNLLGGVVVLLGNLLGGLHMPGINVLGLNISGLLHGLGELLQALLSTEHSHPGLLGGVLNIGGVAGGIDVEGLLGGHEGHGGLLDGILGEGGLLGGLLGPHGLLGGLLGPHGILGGLLGGEGGGLLGGILGGGGGGSITITPQVCARLGCTGQ